MISLVWLANSDMNSAESWELLDFQVVMLNICCLKPTKKSPATSFSWPCKTEDNYPSITDGPSRHRRVVLDVFTPQCGPYVVLGIACLEKNCVQGWGNPKCCSVLAWVCCPTLNNALIALLACCLKPGSAGMQVMHAQQKLLHAHSSMKQIH